MNVSAYILVYMFAFASPERYPPQVTPWTDKVSALLLLSRTGDERGCDRVLVAIRTRREATEQSLVKKGRMRASLEAYVQKKEQMLPYAKEETVKILRDISSTKDTIKDIVWLETFFRKLNEGRKREERAFSLARDLVKTLRQTDRNSPGR